MLYRLKLTDNSPILSSAWTVLNDSMESSSNDADAPVYSPLSDISGCVA